MKWTKERHEKFSATMAAKRAAREAQAKKHKEILERFATHGAQQKYAEAISGPTTKLPPHIEAALARAEARSTPPDAREELRSFILELIEELTKRVRKL